MSSAQRGNALLAPLGSLVVSASGLVALRWFGRGELSGPDGFAPADLTAWIGQRDGAVLAFALLRFAAVAAGVYVLVLSALQLACCIGRRRDLAALIERVTIPALRGVLTGAATMGISASALGSPVAAAEAPPREEVVTMRVLLDSPPGSEPVPVPATAPEAAPLEPSAPVAAGPGAEELWTVEPGDSFWAIAASHLADLRGGPVTDAEIARYWRSLVDANRGILVVPGNVDLLFAGQIVTLVPVT